MAEQNVPSLIAQQIDQLLKLWPPGSSNSTNSMSHTEDIDEEIDYNFAGTAIYLHAKPNSVEQQIT